MTAYGQFSVAVDTTACGASGARKACRYRPESAAGAGTACPRARCTVQARPGLGDGLLLRRHHKRRRIKILNVTDEFTRESLAGHVARHITAKDTVAVREGIVARRGAPAHVRCDNGPEFIAKALARWCARRGSETAHEPGAPWQNPFVESYNGKLRKELLDLELLDSVLEAQVGLAALWTQHGVQPAFLSHRPMARNLCSVRQQQLVFKPILGRPVD